MPSAIAPTPSASLSRPASPEADWQAGGFGVYVHWPFCQAKCPYCDFNSHVRRQVDQDRWRAALLRDLRTQAATVGPRQVDTVFFGGGTPSLMPPETVAAVIAEIGTVWTLADDAEITLEANPTSVEAGRFRGYSTAGVNRVSMGIQALDDAALKALGRLHSASEAQAAFAVARAEFARVSFDLIYARQNQAPRDWEGELRQAAEMAVDHLSLYQLTIEEGTRFGQLAARGALRGLPDTDSAADMFLATHEICARLGMPAYEVSNFARPGAECRHNLVYWRYGDYAGIGPGAHGRLTVDGVRLATETERQPEAWLDRVESSGDGITIRTPLPPEEQAAEYLMMSLRLSEGTDLGRYMRLSGAELDATTLSQLGELGMVSIDDGRLRVTPTGRPVLNAVLRELLA